MGIVNKGTIENGIRYAGETIEFLLNYSYIEGLHKLRLKAERILQIKRNVVLGVNPKITFSSFIFF